MRTIQLQDPELQRFQQNVVDAINPTGIAAGRLVNFTASADIANNTDFIVSHGLGQVPTAVLPALSQIGGLFYVSPTTNPNPSQLMILRCTEFIDAAQSASFWVF